MNKKQRSAIFEHWRGAILRETRDLTSLDQVAARALADPDVREDEALIGEIRAEVEDRRRQFTRHDDAGDEPDGAARAVPESQATTSGQVPTEDIRAAFQRLVHNLREVLDRDEPHEAETILARMRVLQAEYPTMILPEDIRRHEEELASLARGRMEVQEQIESWTRKATDAAVRGDEPAMTDALRRLAGIHAAHLRQLDDARLGAIRGQVALAAEKRAHHLAARKLIEREQSVAAEVKTLTAAVREFHNKARTLPHESDEYRRAEADYRRVVAAVNAHNKEWMAGFILELMDLLAEWGDPPPDAEAQVDRFVETIRARLDRARSEVRAIAAEA